MQPQDVTDLAPVYLEKHASWRHQVNARAYVEQHWEDHYPGVLLFMAMGAGKTKVAIDLADGKPLVLVVCPQRVIAVWKKQLSLHAGYPYMFLALDERSGTSKEKARKARDFAAAATVAHQTAIIAINYESVWLEPFATWALHNLWNLIICDEIHRIKAPAGKASRFMRRLSMRAVRRIGLTGTALPRDPLDAWGIFRFLDPRVFEDTYHAFKTHYAVWGGYQDHQVVGWRDMEEFNRRFYTITFRVTKEEALDLPPEMDHTLAAPLSSEGQRVYDNLENTMMAWLGTAPADQLTVKNALTQLLRLQQLTGGTLRDDRKQEHQVDATKETLLAEWLEDLDPEEPAVVFARFWADLDACARACKRAGRAYAEVSGRSKHGIEEWENQKGGILLAQIQSASEGQDFTRARYMVFYSTGFSLKDYLQARARIHRPGQTRPVAYYHLLLTGTIDEIVMRALERRWDLVEGVLKEITKNVYRTDASRIRLIES